MNYGLCSKIALRYFISGKSHGVVNVISAISLAGVAIATAAIIVILSVFNGFTHLTRERFSAIDPDLAVVPVQGKVITGADNLTETLAGLPGVVAASAVLTDNGLIISDDGAQVGVVFKGVDENYGNIVDFDDITLFQSEYSVDDGMPSVDLSAGVAANLGLRPGNDVTLYTLRRIGRINPANPAGAFFSQNFRINRILQVDQAEFDADNIIIPLEEARALLQYDGDEASAIEIKIDNNVSVNEISEKIKKICGKNTKVLTRDMMHTDAYRMISVEKWVTFAMMIFILVIATFNIVSTLSLLILEKQDNMLTLSFLGASKRFTRTVFSIMGALITCVGGIIGIIIGVGLALAQQIGGFVKLNGDPSRLTIDVYPVRVSFTDVLAVVAIIFGIALIIAFITRIFLRKNPKKT